MRREKKKTGDSTHIFALVAARGLRIVLPFLPTVIFFCTALAVSDQWDAFRVLHCVVIGAAAAFVFRKTPQHETLQIYLLRPDPGVKTTD
jgi:hypothetical protein